MSRLRRTCGSAAMSPAVNMQLRLMGKSLVLQVLNHVLTPDIVIVQD